MNLYMYGIGVTTPGQPMIQVKLLNNVANKNSTLKIKNKIVYKYERDCSTKLLLHNTQWI